jgi:hypothetical protein
MSTNREPTLNIISREMLENNLKRLLIFEIHAKILTESTRANLFEFWILWTKIKGRRGDGFEKIELVVLVVKLS